MDDSNLETLLDHHVIRACPVRLARGEDRRDAELDGVVAVTETHVTGYHRVDTGTEERDTVIGGLMGAPFSGDHYTGTSFGDHSEDFFARADRH